MGIPKTANSKRCNPVVQIMARWHASSFRA